MDYVQWMGFSVYDRVHSFNQICAVFGLNGENFPHLAVFPHYGGER